MTDMNAWQDDPFAKAIFSAASAARDLRQAAAATAPVRSAFPDLCLCLLEPGQPGAEQTLEVALSRLETKDLAEALITRLCVADFPAVAAASSGAIERREQAGFRLRLIPSLDPAGPLYLLIEQLDAGAGRPTLLVGLSADGATSAVARLPEGNAFPLQLMFDVHALIPRLFRDPDSRFYLT